MQIIALYGKHNPIGSSLFPSLGTVLLILSFTALNVDYKFMGQTFIAYIRKRWFKYTVILSHYYVIYWKIKYCKCILKKYTLWNTSVNTMIKTYITTRHVTVVTYMKTLETNMSLYIDTCHACIAFHGTHIPV